MGKRIFRKTPKLMYVGSSPARGGWLNEAHSHAFSEVLFVKEGNGKIEADGKVRPLKKGDLAVISGGLTHREFFDESPAKELVFFAVDNVGLTGGDDNSLLKGERIKIAPSADCYDLFDAALTRLIYESEAGLPFGEDVAGAIVELLLTVLLRLTAYDSELLKQRSRAYREAKEYFDSNFDKMDSLEQVCRSLYINRYYLTHIFKSEEGMPPVKYLMLKRMEKAKGLLETTDKDVNDVAAECGYVDPAYFCRVFKKTQGITPLSYRARFKEERLKSESRS